MFGIATMDIFKPNIIIFFKAIFLAIVQGVLLPQLKVKSYISAYIMKRVSFW